MGKWCADELTLMILEDRLFLMTQSPANSERLRTQGRGGVFT